MPIDAASRSCRLLAGLMALPACRVHPALTRCSSTHAADARGAMPDLQGVWRYEGAIPLERPAQFAGARVADREEVAERQRLEQEQAAKRLAGQEGAAVGPSLGRRVADSRQRVQQLLAGPRAASTGLSGRRRSSSNPPDGRLPYTPDARESRSPRVGALRSRPLRVVSGSGHRRALLDRRRHGA